MRVPPIIHVTKTLQTIKLSRENIDGLLFIYSKFSPQLKVVEKAFKRIKWVNLKWW